MNLAIAQQDESIPIHNPHPYDDGYRENSTNLRTSATTLAPFINTGRSFIGNELSGGTPADNDIAISNGGVIVSVDNFTIETRLEDGTILMQYNEWTNFISQLPDS